MNIHEGYVNAKIKDNIPNHFSVRNNVHNFHFQMHFQFIFYLKCMFPDVWLYVFLSFAKHMFRQVLSECGICWSIKNLSVL